MAKKYIDSKWHYPQKGEYPVIYGEYERKHYPQIPCLVFHRGMYGVRFWNCTEECWDDEECDDFYCSKEEVEKWMYIDSLEQEQPCEDLEKEIENTIDNTFCDMNGIAYLGITGYATVEDMKYIARHFYELGKGKK